MSLSLNEAQILWDAVNDHTFLSAAKAFISEQKGILSDDVAREIRKPERNFYYESRLVGRIEFLDDLLQHLRAFAERQYREVKQ